MRDSILKTYGVFIVTFALTFYTLGAGLIDNYVIYPTFPVIGESEFVAFRGIFSPRIVALLVVPLILRSVFSVLLLWLRPAVIRASHVGLFLLCQLVAWISTFVIQLPIQFQLDKGKNPELIQTLIETVWLRTTMNFVCAGMMFWMMFMVIRSLASSKNETV